MNTTGKEGKRGSIALTLFIYGMIVTGVIMTVSLVSALQSVKVNDSFQSRLRSRTASVSLAIAAQETLYAMRETSPFRSESTFGELYAGWLARLNEGLDEGYRYEADGLDEIDPPGVIMFPIFESEAEIPELAAPSAELLAMAGPIAEQAFGELVAEYVGPTFDVKRTEALAVGEADREWRVETRMAAVPITRYPLHLYTLPSDLPSNEPEESGIPELPRAKVLPGHPNGTESPGGLLGLKEIGAIDSLRSSSLPYYYRPRVALSSHAPQYVFSMDYIRRVSAYCGSTHSLDLGAAGYGDKTLMALLDGVTQTPAQAASNSMTLDLAYAGHGERTLPDSTELAADLSALLFFHVGDSELRIKETELDEPRTDPLLVMVIGSASDEDPKVRVVLENYVTVRRPVIMVCYNVELDGNASRLYAGSLILDPRCSTAEDATIDVAQLTMQDGSELIDPESIRVRSVALPDSVHEIAPRALIAVASADSL